MRLHDNSLLEIQTGESGAIIIYKETRSNSSESNSDVRYTISEIEGYGGVYWSIDKLSSIEACLDYLERPPENPSGYSRDYSSWWLLRKPIYIDELVKKSLIRRIIRYDEAGKISKAVFYREENFGNPSYRYVTLWLELASIDSDEFSKTY